MTDDCRATDGIRTAPGEIAADDLQADMVTLARELADLGHPERAERLCRLADRVFMLSCGIREVFRDRDRIDMWVDRVWHSLSGHADKWFACDACAQEGLNRCNMWILAQGALVTVLRDHARKEDAADLQRAIDVSDQGRIAWHFETAEKGFRESGLDLWSLLTAPVGPVPF